MYACSGDYPLPYPTIHTHTLSRLNVKRRSRPRPRQVHAAKEAIYRENHCSVAPDPRLLPPHLPLPYCYPTSPKQTLWYTAQTRSQAQNASCFLPGSPFQLLIKSLPPVSRTIPAPQPVPPGNNVCLAIFSNCLEYPWPVTALNKH